MRGYKVVELYAAIDNDRDGDYFMVCYDAAAGHEREWQEIVLMVGLTEEQAEGIVKEANATGNPLEYLDEVYGI
jgi:pyrroloquinoline quinone (PQQ) biosynthesis protein C